MELFISIVGAIVTVIGTIVTLWQASKVKDYRKQIELDVRKISLSEVRDFLKRAQDEGRKLISGMQQNTRGLNAFSIINELQSCIDQSISILHLEGPDSDLRTLISDFQKKLISFQSLSDTEEKKKILYEMHELGQNIISTCNHRITGIEYGESK